MNDCGGTLRALKCCCRGKVSQVVAILTITGFIIAIFGAGGKQFS